MTIKSAYLRDSVAAAAEYGAEFRSDIESLFSAEILEQRVLPGRHELAPLPGISNSAFCDPSDGGADSIVLAMAHDEKAIATLDLRDWSAQGAQWYRHS